MDKTSSKGLKFKLFEGKRQAVEELVNAWLQANTCSIVKTQLSTYEWGATVHVAIWYTEENNEVVTTL